MQKECIFHVYRLDQDETRRSHRQSPLNLLLLACEPVDGEVRSIFANAIRYLLRNMQRTDLDIKDDDGKSPWDLLRWRNGIPDCLGDVLRERCLSIQLLMLSRSFVCQFRTTSNELGWNGSCFSWTLPRETEIRQDNQTSSHHGSRHLFSTRPLELWEMNLSQMKMRHKHEIVPEQCTNDNTRRETFESCSIRLEPKANDHPHVQDPIQYIH